MPWYVVVKDEEVPADMRRAAESIVWRCAQDLGLGKVRVVWFRECQEKEAQAANELHKIALRVVHHLDPQVPFELLPGFYSAEPLWGAFRHRDSTSIRQDVLYLNAALSKEQARETAAHEARHLEQCRRYGSAFIARPGNLELLERDANAYAALAVEKWR